MAEKKETVLRWRCTAGHLVVLDTKDAPEKLAEEIRARRERTKACEVGVGGGRVCGAELR